MFISRDEICAYSSAEDSDFCFGTDMVCMYYIQGEYVHFSFILKEKESFGELFDYIDLPQFSPYSKTIELIGRETDIIEYIDIMEDNSFEKFQHYQMWEMNRKKCELPFRYEDIAPLYSDITVCRTDTSMIDEIENVLHQAFSDEVARFPSRKKITEMINDEELICAKVNDAVVGVYLYEMVSSSTCYLHMLACSTEYNGSGAGILLLSYILSEYDKISNFWAWVEENNHDSNRIIKSYGFEKNDFLKYYVMRKGV